MSTTASAPPQPPPPTATASGSLPNGSRPSTSTSSKSTPPSSPATPPTLRTATAGFGQNAIAGPSRPPTSIVNGTPSYLSNGFPGLNGASNGSGGGMPNGLPKPGAPSDPTLPVQARLVLAQQAMQANMMQHAQAAQGIGRPPGLPGGGSGHAPERQGSGSTPDLATMANAMGMLQGMQGNPANKDAMIKQLQALTNSRIQRERQSSASALPSTPSQSHTTISSSPSNTNGQSARTPSSSQATIVPPPQPQIAAPTPPQSGISAPSPAAPSPSNPQQQQQQQPQMRPPTRPPISMQGFVNQNGAAVPDEAALRAAMANMTTEQREAFVATNKARLAQMQQANQAQAQHLRRISAGSANGRPDLPLPPSAQNPTAPNAPPPASNPGPTASPVQGPGQGPTSGAGATAGGGAGGGPPPSGIQPSNPAILGSQRKSFVQSLLSYYKHFNQTPPPELFSGALPGTLQMGNHTIELVDLFMAIMRKANGQAGNLKNGNPHPVFADYVQSNNFPNPLPAAIELPRPTGSTLPIPPQSDDPVRFMFMVYVTYLQGFEHHMMQQRRNMAAMQQKQKEAMAQGQGQGPQGQAQGQQGQGQGQQGQGQGQQGPPGQQGQGQQGQGQSGPPGPGPITAQAGQGPRPGQGQEGQVSQAQPQGPAPPRQQPGPSHQPSQAPGPHQQQPNQPPPPPPQQHQQQQQFQHQPQQQQQHQQQQQPQQQQQHQQQYSQRPYMHQQPPPGYHPSQQAPTPSAYQASTPSAMAGTPAGMSAPSPATSHFASAPSPHTFLPAHMAPSPAAMHTPSPPPLLPTKGRGPKARKDGKAGPAPIRADGTVPPGPLSGSPVTLTPTGRKRKKTKKELAAEQAASEAASVPPTPVTTAPPPPPIRPPTPKRARYKVEYRPLHHPVSHLCSWDERAVSSTFPKHNLQQPARPLHELGIIDMEAILMGLRSRLKRELGYGLTVLNMLSMSHPQDNSSGLPIAQLQEIYVELLELLEELALGEEGLEGWKRTQSVRRERERDIKRDKRAAEAVGEGDVNQMSFLELEQIGRDVDWSVPQTPDPPRQRTDHTGGYTDSILSILNLLRNLSLMPENQPLMGNSNLVHVLAAVTDSSLVRLPSSASSAGASDSAPYSLLEFARVRRDAVIILGNIGPYVDLRTCEPWSVLSTFRLLASFLTSAWTSLSSKESHYSPATVSVRESPLPILHSVNRAMEAWCKLAQADNNREVLANIPPNELLALYQSLLQLLPQSKRQFESIQISEETLGQTEVLALSLYSLAFLAPPSVRKIMRKTTGSTTMFLRIITKLGAGPCPAYVDRPTPVVETMHHPFAPLCRRLAEMLGVLNGTVVPNTTSGGLGDSSAMMSFGAASASDGWTFANRVVERGWSAGREEEVLGLIERNGVDSYVRQELDGMWWAGSEA